MSLRYQIKLLVLGESGVGKTCLLNRFVDGTFSSQFYATVGVDFKLKQLALSENRVADLQIWDTAGQERFKTITSSFYRGANGVIIVYQLTNRSSFHKVQAWIEEINKYSPKVFFSIVGNKLDLEEERQVHFQEGLFLSQSCSAEFNEVSSKTGEGVDDVFRNLAYRIIQKGDLKSTRNPSYSGGLVFGDESRVLLAEPSGQARESCCC